MDKEDVGQMQELILSGVQLWSKEKEKGHLQA